MVSYFSCSPVLFAPHLVLGFQIVSLSVVLRAWSKQSKCSVLTEVFHFKSRHVKWQVNFLAFIALFKLFKYFI